MMKCKYCGCTDERACEGGCTWIANEICSACVTTIPRILLAELLTVVCRCAKGQPTAGPACAAVELYVSLEEAGEAPPHQELIEELRRFTHQQQKPQIILATEADIPPFARELQL